MDVAMACASPQLQSSSVNVKGASECFVGTSTTYFFIDVCIKDARRSLWLLIAARAASQRAYNAPVVATTGKIFASSPPSRHASGQRVFRGAIRGVRTRCDDFSGERGQWSRLLFRRCFDVVRFIFIFQKVPISHGSLLLFSAAGEKGWVGLSFSKLGSKT